MKRLLLGPVPCLQEPSFADPPREQREGALTVLCLERDLGRGRPGAALALPAALAGERWVCLQLPVGLGATQGAIPCPSAAAQLRGVAGAIHHQWGAAQGVPLRLA